MRHDLIPVVMQMLSDGKNRWHGCLVGILSFTHSEHSASHFVKNNVAGWSGKYP